MFSSRGSTKFLSIIRITLLFDHVYLPPPVEAMNGVIWSKTDGDFVQIYSIKTFDEINHQRISISRGLETHDFNGTILKLTSFPIDNLIDFISNDTVVTGVHGDMWQLLAGMLNFKIHIVRLTENAYGTRSENGSWSGLLGYVYRNETDILPRCVIASSRVTALDFTFATWMTSYRFYGKKEAQYPKTWMADLFARKLWLSIVGLFFVLTLASFSIHVLNFDEKNSRDSISNLRDHFFYIFSIFCNQGWTPQQLVKRSKILILSTRLSAWLLVISFSSQLISHIAEKKFNPPFDDLESFYKNTDYKLILKGNSFMYSIFMTSSEPIYKTINDAGRLMQTDASSIAYKKTCSGKYIYLDSQDVVEAENSKLCVLTPFGKPFVSTWIAGGLVRGFKYRRTMDLGMLKLNEFGIMTRVKLKWLKKTTLQTRIPNEFRPIGLEHVSLIFTVLFIAVLLSLVILLIENIFYLKNLHDRRSYVSSYNN